LTLDAATGAFTYVPAAGFSGADSFTFEASDGLASSNVATVSLTVNPGSTPPVLSLSPAQVTETEITFPASASGGTGALSYRLVGAPGGATIAQTGTFHWTPGAGQLGSFPVTVQVTDA